MFRNMREDRFKKFFKKCIGSRLDDLDNKNRLSSDYGTFYKNSSRILEEIRDNLPEELHPILEEYSDIQEKYIYHCQKYFYNHGFMDCSTLMNSLYK